MVRCGVRVFGDHGEGEMKDGGTRSNGRLGSLPSRVITDYHSHQNSSRAELENHDSFLAEDSWRSLFLRDMCVDICGSDRCRISVGRPSFAIDC